MLVSLFTSRVILQSLGVVEFGIYNVVGGTVALFSFINLTLSGATSRFLTFELGKGNMQKLRETFSSSLTVHIIIALFVLILAETIGLWFMYNKVNMPAERFGAALIVYQISILTSIVSILQTPFTASIVSHENMGIYAYVSIFECLAKLAIAYIIFIVSWDKLVIYSILLGLFAIFIFLIYTILCLRKYQECNLKPIINKSTLIPIMSYSGWDLYGNLSSVARTYGVTVILNIFFGAAINAATGVANQVQNAVMGFVENFTTAVKPQIVKYYASENRIDMVSLIYMSSKFSFILLFLISYPLIMEAKFVLNLWLVEVPAYSIAFTQLCLMIGWNSALFRPIVYGIHSTGMIRNISIVNGTIILLVIPLSIMAFRHGLEPYWVYIINILLLLTSSIYNVRQLSKLIDEFSPKGFLMNVLKDCCKVVLPVICLTMLILNTINESTLRFFLVLTTSIVTVLFTSWFFVADKSLRKKFIRTIKEKL